MSTSVKEHLLEPGVHVHFVGIGGAGMSALAKVLIERGYAVSGSDLKHSRSTAALAAMGARINVAHDAANLGSADVVVVSAAIPEGNVELVTARERNLPIVTRGEALAAVLQGSSALVVAGTHGKTTTTSMVVSIMNAAGQDPSYLIGGGLNDVGTNARSGGGRWTVAESDESDGSFLLLEPDVAVVTNVELDHVDRWNSIEALRDAFQTFVSRVKRGGALVAPTADPLVDFARASGLRVLTFGEGGLIDARDATSDASGTRFTLIAGDDEAPARLYVPGHHNVMNALAAAAACLETGLALGEIAAGLAAYKGVERRFQLKGRAGGVTVVDDYAHHPTEIQATLAAAKPGAWRRVVAVFQPHRYSRTAALWQEFGSSFAGADVVVVTDVYGAGEMPVPGITGKLVCDAIAASFPGRPLAYFPHRRQVVDYLAASCRPGDVVLTLGAGDITSLGDELLARFASPSVDPS